MATRILILQGHPDPREKHLCHALAEAYRRGAMSAGREVRLIDIAASGFCFIGSAKEWEAEPPPEVKAVQGDILWADHIVIVYPLWMGTMPAVVKGFLEQVFRPGFAFRLDANPLFHKTLEGRSARIVVTMGMPAFVYRWYFGAHGLKNLERNLMRFVGFKPVEHTVLGLVENVGNRRRKRWLEKMETLGKRGR